ncbi:MAG: hypothetical protein EOM12_12695 [Verrucomicrobiae bacterium]|nr:hypothetical protein [Verrucomicrobiae bacterium]
MTVCSAELAQVKTLIDNLGFTSTIVPYLTKYAVVRACGSVELAFKAVIADYCSRRGKKQVKRFLTRKVRDGSANPSYDKICQFLHDFDEEWKRDFKGLIEQEANKANLLTSLQSLVDARNDFAHGGNPSASIGDVLVYYGHARRIIEIMDGVVQ